MSRLDDFIPRSWGGLGRSWRSFRLIISLSLLASIFQRFFYRFWSGFGRVLGCQSGRKIEILGVFGSILFDTLFSIDFRVIFEKIGAEKHMKFRLFFNELVSYTFAEIAVFHNAGILKISDFP